MAQEDVNVVWEYVRTAEHLITTTERTLTLEGYADIAEQAEMYVDQQDGCQYMVRGERQ